MVIFTWEVVCYRGNNSELGARIFILALLNSFVTLSKSLTPLDFNFLGFNKLARMISAFLWLLNGRILGLSFFLYIFYMAFSVL